MERLIDANNLQFNGRNYNKSQMKAILDFIDAQPTVYDPNKVVQQLKYNITLFIDKDGEKVLLYDAIEIVKAGGNADLLIDRAKSKSGERIPYDGKWK